jgi:hypothetical protein
MALSIKNNLSLLRRRNKYYRVIVACGMVLLSLIPYQSTTVPEWRLRVITTQGEPLTGVQVYQTWQYYGLDSSGTFNSDIKVTDETGYVFFPKRTVNASLLQRSLAFLGDWVNINPHASSGPYAHISVHRGGTTYSADYKGGEELPSELIVDD